MSRILVALEIEPILSLYYNMPYYLLRVNYSNTYDLIAVVRIEAR
jgi:hypothetical protein